MTMNILRSFWILCCLLLLPLAAKAEITAKTDITETRLLLSHDAIQTNETLWVAIEMSLTDEWHAYWQNPGDSGISTSLEWTLPDTISHGPIQWLPPKRIEYSGLYNYGYSGKTAFLVPMEVAADTPNGQYPISVKASWLVCKDICIPESANFSTSITVADESVYSDDAVLIDHYVSQLPQLHLGKMSYAKHGDKITVEVQFGETPEISKAWIYPIDDGIIANDSDQLWLVADNTVIIRANAGLSEPTDILHGVLELTNKEGLQQFYTIGAKHMEQTPVAQMVGADSHPTQHANNTAMAAKQTKMPAV